MKFPDSDVNGQVVATKAVLPTNWRAMDGAPRDRPILLQTLQGLIYCGRWRAGTLGEPQPAEIGWRCNSSGRFTHPVLWAEIPT